MTKFAIEHGIVDRRTTSGSGLSTFRWSLDLVYRCRPSESGAHINLAPMPGPGLLERHRRAAEVSSQLRSSGRRDIGLMLG
jgi:hypothetical protein